MGFIGRLIGKLRRKWARSSKPEGLYSRLEGKAVLEHRVRKTLLSTIKRQPGLSFPELQAVCGLSAGTVEWHLDKLQGQGFITASRDGRTRRYFPKATPPEMKKAVLLLRDPSRRELITRVLRNPDTPQGVLAERMGLTHATVHHHAQKLLRAGLLDKRKEGRTVGYVVPAEAEKVVTKALGMLPP